MIFYGLKGLSANAVYLYQRPHFYLCYIMESLGPNVFSEQTDMLRYGR